MDQTAARGIRSLSGAWVALVITIAVILVSGCGCERDKPATTGSPAPTGDAAANAAFPSEHTVSGMIQLKEGHYQDDDLVSSELDELTARGDVDGNDTEDLVVVLVTNTGGSGIFYELYALRNEQPPQNNAIRVSIPAFLGDRVVVNKLRIEQNTIVVDLVVQGPNDPLCCPTLPVTWRFRLDGNSLVRIADTTPAR